MKDEPIAIGKVESLCINGMRAHLVPFDFGGPLGDRHRKMVRPLSGHDGGYMRTSDVKRGHRVFNWRQWTALSTEEMTSVSESLGVEIPVGCLLENMIISGVPYFSKLKPTSRLVFPLRDTEDNPTQLILGVWEQNDPCGVVGRRLEEHYQQPGLSGQFVREAKGYRGLMGIVLAVGVVEVGDSVLVYPPIED